MSWALAGASFQYLGRISYSLYLMHLPIGGRVISAGLELLPNPDIAAARLLFLLAVAASLVAATVSWRLIEAPTMRLSRRVRLPARAAAPASPPTTPVRAAVNEAG